MRFSGPKNRQQKNSSSARGVKALSSPLVTFIILQGVTYHEIRNISRRVEDSFTSLLGTGNRRVRISHYRCAASGSVFFHDIGHQIPEIRV